MRALFYLTTRRILNSVKRMPKNPRLLVPVLIFALVLVSQLMPIILLNRTGTSPSHHLNLATHRSAHGIAATPAKGLGPDLFVATIKAILLFSVLSSVVSAFGDGSLFFDPCDVDFLFPTPLSRRAVLLFRMLFRYLVLAMIALYLPITLGTSLLISTPGLNLLSLWPGALGTFLFLITSANIAQAAVIFRWGKEGSGATPAQRKRATTLGFCLAGLAIAAGFALMHQSEEGTRRGGFGIHAALRALNGHATSLVIAPVSWAADLFRVAFDGWGASAAGRLAGLLLLTAFSFVVLFLRESDFYEGATEVSARRRTIVSAVRRGDSGAMLSQMAEDGTLRAGSGRVLTSFGGGARAVLWRDLIMLGRVPVRSWLTMMAIAVFPAFFSHLTTKRTDIGVLTWMTMFCLQMSGIYLAGVRTMLRRADITKALPIGPVRFLLAEQATSIVQLTLLGWLSLTLMVLFGNGHGPFLVVAYVLFPTLSALIIFVQTSFVLLYPKQNDVAQNVVGNLLGLLASALALVPCVGIGLLMYFFLQSPPLLIGLVACSVNIVATAAAVLLAAFLWQRFDPTS